MKCRTQGHCWLSCRLLSALYSACRFGPLSLLLRPHRNALRLPSMVVCLARSAAMVTLHGRWGQGVSKHSMALLHALALSTLSVSSTPPISLVSPSTRLTQLL